MTPQEARDLMPRYQKVDPAKVSLVLDLWHCAIRCAASENRNFVRESQLSRPRCPIPRAAYDQALAALKESGFNVIKDVADGPNETTTEVNWV